MRRMIVLGLVTFSTLMPAFALSRNVVSKVSKFYVYRSVNNGASWVKARVGPPELQRIHALAVDTTMSYAGTDDGIFVSSDDGANWLRAAYGPTRRVQSLLVSHGVVYAGTDDGVYLSRDRGRTWDASTRGLTGANVRSLATNGTIVLAGTDRDGVFFLTGAGDWQKFGEGLPEHSQVFDLAATPSHIYAALYGKGLYRIGTRHLWEKVGEVEPLQVLARGNAIVAGHNPGGIQQSADDGQTWRIAAGLSRSAPIWVLGDAGPTLFAGTTPGGVLRSEDSGANWQPSAFGLPPGAAVVAVSGSRSVALAAIVVQED